MTANAKVHSLREVVRRVHSTALRQCISPFGRAAATGWYDPTARSLTVGGCIVIAIIRAELKRRQPHEDIRQ